MVFVTAENEEFYFLSGLRCTNIECRRMFLLKLKATLIFLLRNVLFQAANSGNYQDQKESMNATLAA